MRPASRCRPSKHHEVARACLEAGVHVLVEKPLARTLAEADALLELARAKGLVLQVGHLQRFNPAFQALAAAGGRPLFIDIERLAPFKARGTDVDVVLDLMIHDLDLVLALARAPVEQVSACGFRVLTDASTSPTRASNSPTAASPTSRRAASARRRCASCAFSAHDGYVRPTCRGSACATCAGAADGIEESEQAFERVDELRAQAEDFLRAVRERGAPLVSGEQGRAALALAHRIGGLIAREAGAVKLAFTKMEGAGNDFRGFRLYEGSSFELQTRTNSKARRPPFRRRLRPGPGGREGGAGRASISATASSTPTAARWSSAATARAAS